MTAVPPPLPPRPGANRPAIPAHLDPTPVGSALPAAEGRGTLIDANTSSSAEYTSTSSPPTTVPSIPGSLFEDAEADLISPLTVLQAEEWQRLLEDKQIEQYLIDFNKHVRHLRIPAEPEPGIQPEKPVIADYMLRPDSSPGQTSSIDEWSWTQVDWLAYGQAWMNYTLGPKKPLPPLEPFTVARLRSNGTRLYTVARPMWEAFGLSVARICLWENKQTTTIIVTIYLTLVATSTLLPVLLLLPLYPLFRHRFYPPSAIQQYQAMLAAKEQSEELSDLVDGLSDDIENPASASDQSPGNAFGLGLDLNRAKDLAAGLEDLTGVDTDASSSKRKQGKKATLRRKIKQMEDEYGAGAIVVLGDLADLHEKLKNLYLWRSPSAANYFATALVSASLFAYITPLWILAKLVQLALGAVAFIVVPVIAAQERYEPMAWMAGSAPTDADYAVTLLKQRQAAGVPLLSRTLTEDNADTISMETNGSSTSSPTATTATTSKDRWNSIKKAGNGGLALLEASRQITSGERDYKISFAPRSAVTDVSGARDTKKIGLGKIGPGLVLSRNINPDRLGINTYFAQYGRVSGILSISHDQISFKPVIGKSKTTQPNSSTTESPEMDTLGSGKKPAKDRTVSIAMSDVVGIKKRDTTSLFVIIAAGLDIECANGTTVSFALVANRDHAFHMLLVLCERNLVKV